MNSKKKLNLLPEEVKNKYANRYLAYAASILGGILLLIFVFQYAQIGILSWQTNRIIEKNEEYDNEKNVIVELEKSIKQYRTLPSRSGIGRPSSPIHQSMNFATQLSGSGLHVPIKRLRI